MTEEQNTLPSGSTDSIQRELIDPKDPNAKQIFMEKVLGETSSKDPKQSKVERHPGSGNKPKETLGLLRISKKCKICQSPHREEITKALLNGMTYREIIKTWGDKFTSTLNPVNINSHRKHCDPKAVAKIDANKRELSLTDFSPAVVQLFQQKYDEALNKFKTVNLLYDARLRNLWELLSMKKHIEEVKIVDRTDAEKRQLKDLTTAIDEIMKGLTKDLLNHIKIEQGPGVVQVNVAMVTNFKKGIEEFIDDFMDVLVEEIDDPLTREKIKERFVEKLDTRISPLLDPSKMVTVDAKIIDADEEDNK